MRRVNNAGKREREARKRHRPAVVVYWPDGTEAVLLKLGRKHLLRWASRIHAVADAEKPGESVR